MSAKPSAFGAYTVDASMGEGRFGPLFHAHDAAGQSVVVRTFTQPFTDAERARLDAALKALCQTSLEHPAIARPLASGIADGRPYLVHTYLPGSALPDDVRVSGSPTLGDFVLRLTHVAGALDYAAAAGVVHGALSARDIIVSSEAAGVSGFGLVQALETAGVPGFHARRDDDLRSLADITKDLTGIEVPGTFLTALEFVGALQAKVPPTPAPPLEPALPPVPDAPDSLDLAFDEAPTLPPLEDVSELPPFSDVSAPFDMPLRDVPTLPMTPPPPASSSVPAMPTMFGAGGGAVEEPRRGRMWLLVPAIVLIVTVGVLLGFAGGFVGTHEDRAVKQAAAAPAPPPAPAAEPPAGQTYTDGTVEDAKPPASAPVPPAVVPQAPAPRSETPAPKAETPAPKRQPAPPAPVARPIERHPAPAKPPVVEAPRSGPAAIRVESHPVGAQVFVDGRSVGYAPLVVGDLTPGTHSVRMQLPGYHPWVSAVTLGPGARDRVAASLEQ